MLLKDLVLKHDWPGVRTTLQRLYPDQARNLEGYQLVLEQLRAVAPAASTMSIVIVTEIDEETGKSHAAVYGNERASVGPKDTDVERTVLLTPA